MFCDRLIYKSIKINSKMIGWIISGIILLVLIIFLYYYNRFVVLSNRIDNSLSQINVQLKRRADLIPNLIETVKGYAKHEKTIIKSVNDARKALVGAKGIEKKIEANKKLESFLGKLFAIAENYPDLKANTNFLELQRELSSTEDRVAYARQFYNDSILSYNNMVQQLPGKLFANLYGRKEKEYLKIAEAEKKNVKVIIRQTMDKYSHVDFRDEISRNKWKSFFLLGIIFLVFILFGYVISFAFSPDYFFIVMIVSIIFSLSYIFLSYYNSGSIAVASARAKRASREKYKQYYDIVEGLTIASGIPMPKLYIMESNQINAFASGRDPKNAVVCITSGALEKLDKRELEGVLAHELGHVANYDIRYMTIATVVVGIIAIISEIFLRSLWFRGGNDNKNGIFILAGIIMAILAPIIVQLVQLAISRKRELNADASAVKFTRYPQGLIRALKKIEKENYPERHISKAIAPLFFSNPLKNISSTHPPIEKRIKILERM